VERKNDAVSQVDILADIVDPGLAYPMLHCRNKKYQKTKSMPEMPMGLINSACAGSSDIKMLPNHEPHTGLNSPSLARMNGVLFDVIGFTTKPNAFDLAARLRL
jgi:hypothetical protein